MNDLISREYMIERIRNSGYTEQIKSNLFLMARMAPAVDAVEVRHGYWMEDGNNQPMSNDKIYCCSNCRKEHYFRWQLKPFCANCGARMDGRRGGTQCD